MSIVGKDLKRIKGKKSKNISIGHFNAGSLSTKHEEFIVAVENHSPDILSINETWLREGEEGRAPRITGYRLRHTPRPKEVRARGGGVGFYVKRGISARTLRHPAPANPAVEQMWISVNINSTRLVIGTAYRPPWLDCDLFFDTLTDTIVTLRDYDHVVLLGDFNINFNIKNSNMFKRADSFLKSFNLINYIHNSTHFTSHSDTLIDLFCSDINVSGVIVDHIPDLGGHAMLYGELKIKKNKTKNQYMLTRPIKSINLSSFNNCLEAIDWNGIREMGSVNAMVSTLNTIFIDLYDVHAPMKRIPMKETFHPWLTSNVRYMMRLRNRAADKRKKNNTEDSINHYKSLKHLVNISLYYEKCAYFNFYINSHVKNSYYLWKNLKKNILTCLNKPKELPDDFNNADDINNHFLDIPGTSDMSMSSLTYFEFHRFSNCTFKLSSVSESEIGKIILDIKSNALGIDQISRDMVLLTLPHSLKTLTFIINESISTGVFPKYWRTAVVRPIPKVNNPSKVKELRPISLLPYLSKILEKVVYKQVQKYLEENQILPSLQSGFRKGRSTATALLDVIDNILAAQDTGMATIITLLDFSRAFDSINITLLLSKLSYYGFDVNSVNWFHSYLFNRKQLVSLRQTDGSYCNSVAQPVDRGVPQGSILGPLLFILYSADLVTNIKHCKYHLYADDLQIYTSFIPKDVHSAVELVNEDLERVGQWSLKNSLFLNPFKSKFLILGTKQQVIDVGFGTVKITINDAQVERVYETRNLGLIIDATLHFENYVQEVARNCFYRLKVLYNIRDFIDTELRTKLCEALILSKLNYCISVYGPNLLQRSMRLVQRVQNACARYCYNIPPRTHISPYLNDANILNMKSRIELHFTTLLFGVVKNKAPDYLYDKLSWRSCAFNSRRILNRLNWPRHKSAAFRGSFRYLATKCWNNIPPPLRSLNSIPVFKKYLRKNLLTEQKSLCSSRFFT